METNPNKNFLLILLRSIFVLVLVVIFSDLIGQRHQETEQYQKMETTAKLILLKTELQLLPRKTVFPPQTFYSLIKKVIEHNQDFYLDHEAIDTFLNEDLIRLDAISCGSRCRSFVGQTSWRNWFGWNSYQFAQWYYVLGLESYKDGNNLEATYFMDIARRLAPEWSYYHLELANLFFLQNQVKRGQLILQECQQFAYGRLNCQISEQDKMWNQNNSVGFLFDAISGGISEMEFLK